MQEDETLVIGGLIEDNTSRNVTKIPVLGDIPVFGRLFRSESVNHTRNELIITVTPHVLNPGAANIMPGPPLPNIPTPAPLPTLPPGTLLPGATHTQGPVALPTSSVLSQPAAVPSAAITPGTSSYVSVSTNQDQPAAQPNVYTYGKVPVSTYAAQNDAVQIFYATFSPTVLKNNDIVQIKAITTINVKTLSVGYPGFVTQLAQTSPGQWQTTYNFSTATLPAGQSAVSVVLKATGTTGQAASIQIPVNVIP